MLPALPPLQLWHGLPLLHAAAVALGLLLYVVLTHSGRQRRTPSAAMAWVLALIAFPYLALPIYLALGTRKLTHRAQARTGPSGGITLDASCGIDLPPARYCTAFQLHCDGEQALTHLLDLLARARHSIDIEMFIFRDDAVGARITSSLAAAVQRGVQVRMLLDGVGAFIGHRHIRRVLCAAGVQLRWFSPLRLHLRPHFGRGNLRNHRKLVLVDAHTLWSGGRNFACEYFGPATDAAAWCDLSFCIEGGIVADAMAGFAHDWAMATSAPLPNTHIPTAAATANTGVLAQLLPSGPDRREDTAYALYLSAFYRANTRIWLATPYFVPDDALQQALLQAARRGVDVQLLLPMRSNHRMADIARERSLRELAAADVQIHLFPNMLHAKLVLIDHSFASCGSINLDGRSLFLNYELNTLLFDEAAIRQFSHWFCKQRAHATAYNIRAPGWLRDVGEGMVRALGFQL